MSNNKIVHRSRVGVGHHDMVPRVDKSEQLNNAGLSSDSPYNGLNSSIENDENVGGFHEKDSDVHVLDLGTLATDQLIEFSGTVVEASYARDTTGPTTDVDAIVYVKLDDKNAPARPFTMGRILSGQPFRRLYLTWAAQTSKELTLELWKDDKRDRLDNE